MVTADDRLLGICDGSRLLALCRQVYRARNVLPPSDPSGAVTTYMFAPGADLISPALYMVKSSLPSLSATHTYVSVSAS